MPDNNPKNIDNAPEALDLRTEAKEKPKDKPVRIELPPLPEQLETHEHAQTQESGEFEEGNTGQEQASPGGIITSGQVRRAQEKRIREIENALADGLDDFYLAMDREKQTRFKEAGELACREIDDLMVRKKSTARKIVDIIKKWLAMIPGLNKFFLEQEAKIKADKILAMRENYV